MGLFSGKCEVPAEATDYKQRGTAYSVIKWISIVCTGITVAILLVLKCIHLTRYTRPKEQRQILRILIAPSTWALISLGQIMDYQIAQYLLPIGEVYESLYLCSVFLLFIQYAAPGAEFNGEMFTQVSAADEGNIPVGFDWPRMTWIMVFQYPIFEAISAAIVVITEVEGVYCAGNYSPKFGNLWASVIQSVSLGAAIMTIWNFHKRMKNRLKEKRGLAKLVGFKAIVGIMWIQSIIFGVLLDKHVHVLKPNKTFSYVDYLYGLPATITCVEMVFFACWFWWVCSPSEYSTSRQINRAWPIWKALIHSFNFWDIIRGIYRLFTVSKYMHKTGGFKDWQDAKAAAKARKADNNNSGKEVDRASGPLSKLIGAAGRAMDREQRGGLNRGEYVHVPEDMELLERPNATNQG